MTEGQTTVRVRDCLCPGSPHPDGDEVYLAPQLSMKGGMAAATVAGMHTGDPIGLAEGLADVYLRFGVQGWNLVDEDGRPLAYSPEAAEQAFPYGAGGMLISDACDDLYARDILGPFQDRLAKLSGRGSMGSTPQETSRKLTSIPSRRRRSSTASTGRARRSA